MKIKPISLTEMARSGAIGPIQIGGRLSDFALRLGPPNRWGDFSDRERLSCIMTFGCVEVGLEGRNNDAVVTWAKFWLHGFRHNLLDFAHGVDGARQKIFNPFAMDFPTYNTVEKKIRSEGIMFTKQFLEPVGGETSAVMNFGRHLRFYFTGRRTPKLTLVSLSNWDHGVVVDELS